MPTPFSYSITYTLDKSHFSETFDESVIIDNAKAVYLKPIVLAFMGLSTLFFSEINPYAAWFIIALAALEALSIRFRKSWWLAKQLLSKAAQTAVTLTLDNEKVCSTSFHVESKIYWRDMDKIEQTSQGWLLYHSGGKNYLSGRCLSDEAKEFIGEQAALLASK